MRYFKCKTFIEFYSIRKTILKCSFNLGNYTALGILHHLTLSSFRFIYLDFNPSQFIKKSSKTINFHDDANQNWKI